LTGAGAFAGAGHLACALRRAQGDGGGGAEEFGVRSLRAWVMGRSEDL